MATKTQVPQGYQRLSPGMYRAPDGKLMQRGSGGQMSVSPRSGRPPQQPPMAMQPRGGRSGPAVMGAKPLPPQQMTSGAFQPQQDYGAPGFAPGKAAYPNQYPNQPQMMGGYADNSENSYATQGYPSAQFPMGEPMSQQSFQQMTGQDQSGAQYPQQGEQGAQRSMQNFRRLPKPTRAQGLLSQPPQASVGGWPVNGVR